MRTDDSVCFRVGDKLDEARRIIGSKRPSVGRKRKLPNPDIHSLFFCEILRHTNSCDLRIGIDNSRDDVVVHMSGLAGDHLHAGDAFFFGFVRKHWAGDDIPDRINAFDVRPEMCVHFDALPVIQFHADLVRADSFRESPAADGDQYLIGIESELFLPFGRLGRRPPVFHFHFANLRFQMEFHSLRGQHFLQSVRNLEIKTERDAWQKFEHRYVRSETAPDRAHLETDRATADYQQLLGDFWKGERFRAANNDLAIELHAGQIDRHTAGGDDDMLRFYLLGVALRGLDRDLSRSGDGPESLKSGDLVQLH